MADARARGAPLHRPSLQIRGLNVYYGASHALQGVDLTLEHGVLSVVGRNGMGKTTLCKAIMGLVPVATGSIRFGGQTSSALAPAEIARLGIGYVPQGRRLWRVADRRRASAAGRRRRKGAWTIDRIYATFPRLAERTHQWRRAALRRRAADAGDLARAAAEPAPADHGRADRGAGAGDRRPGRGDAGAAGRGGRHRRPGHRAEHRRRHRDRRAASRSWSTAGSTASSTSSDARRPIATCSSACSASAATAMTTTPARPRRARPGPESGESSRTAAARRRSTSPTRCMPTRWSQPVPVARIEAAGRAPSSSSAGDARRRSSTATASPASRAATATRLSWSPARSTPRARSCASCAICLRRRACAARLVDLSTSGKPSSAEVPPPQVARLPSARRRRRLHRRPRPVGRRHDRGVRDAGCAQQSGIAGIIVGGRLGRHGDGHAGDARAAGRRAQADDLDRGLGRCPPICRRRRHHDDALGRRRAGPELRSPARCSPTARTR